MSKTISIKLADDLYKKLKSRAAKQYLEVPELLEDIVRRSMLSYRKNAGTSKEKVDDALVPLFSRNRRGRRK